MHKDKFVKQMDAMLTHGFFIIIYSKYLYPDKVQGSKTMSIGLPVTTLLAIWWSVSVLIHIQSIGLQIQRLPHYSLWWL